MNFKTRIYYIAGILVFLGIAGFFARQPLTLSNLQLLQLIGLPLSFFLVAIIAPQFQKTAVIGALLPMLWFFVSNIIRTTNLPAVSIGHLQGDPMDKLQFVLSRLITAELPEPLFSNTTVTGETAAGAFTVHGSTRRLEVSSVYEKDFDALASDLSPIPMTIVTYVSGFSLQTEPIRGTARFIADMTAGTFGDELALRSAADQKDLWNSFSHRAYAWWQIGTHELLLAIESRDNLTGHLKCAEDAYKTAAGLFFVRDNTELWMALQNNLAVLNWLKVLHSTDKANIRLTRKLILRGLKAQKGRKIGAAEKSVKLSLIRNRYLLKQWVKGDKQLRRKRLPNQTKKNPGKKKNLARQTDLSAHGKG